jgi:hypothetical protein
MKNMGSIKKYKKFHHFHQKLANVADSSLTDRLGLILINLSTI